MDVLSQMIENYGYGILFLALFLEMLALPLPGEAIMSYAGLLVYEHKLNFFAVVLIAWVGVSLGMTVSYWIGYRLGLPFFEKHGSRFHLGPTQLNKISIWFQKIGNKLLLLTYYIPGVRHVTGYFSGVTRLSFRRYAIFAYSGALIWVCVFVSLGYVLGPKWEQFHGQVNRYLLLAGLAGCAIMLLVYLYRNHKQAIVGRFMMTLELALRTFHSMGKVKFVVLAASGLFFLLVALMIGLIQTVLEQEFAQFDEVTAYIVDSMFGVDWTLSMNRLAILGSYYVFAPLIAITVGWIWLLGKNRLLEISFLAVVVVGGEVWDEALRVLFHRVGPEPSAEPFPYTFPSEQTLITLTVIGFAAFLIFRHYGDYKLRLAAVLLVLLVSTLVGISRIYFDVQYPSDVVAGYVFGGVWLTLNIVLLEVFRALQNSASS